MPLLVNLLNFFIGKSIKQDVYDTSVQLAKLFGFMMPFAIMHQQQCYSTSDAYVLTVISVSEYK